MCITKTECWVYKEKPYLTEIDAVIAALEDIGQKIMRKHSAHPFQGLLEYGEDITPLRHRYLELLALGQTQSGDLEDDEPGPGTQPKGVPLYDDFTGTVAEKSDG